MQPGGRRRRGAAPVARRSAQESPAGIHVKLPMCIYIYIYIYKRAHQSIMGASACAICCVFGCATRVPKHAYMSNTSGARAAPPAGEREEEELRTAVVELALRALRKAAGARE